MPLITYSSIDKTYGTDAAFTIVADQTLQGYSQVRLHQLNMVNSLYNVTAERNEFIIHTSLLPDGSTPITVTVTLANGNYDLVDMLDALKTGIDAEITPATSTLTYNNITGKLSLTTSTSLYLSVQPTALNIMLGFSTSKTTSFATTVVSPRILNLIRYPNLYLISSVSRDRSYLSAASERLGILDSILIDVDFGGVVQYTPSYTTNFLPLNSGDITTSSFYLLDDQGATVDLNGSYMTIVLEVF